MSYNPRVLQRSFAGGEMSPQMFGRPDDAKLVNGAALMQNYLPHPTGAISRRPGTALVRATKDATQKSHLFPFVFSNDQSIVIEASRATVQSREIGHFRFHVDGGTLLYANPSTYQGPVGTTANFNTGTDEFTAASHGLVDGDPVVFTMLADSSSTLLAAVSFPSRTTAQDQVVDVGALTTMAVGSEVMFDANGGTIPSTVEEGRVYYLTANESGTLWNFSRTYDGPNVKGSGIGSTGQQRVSAMPRISGTEFGIHRVYYAIETGANTFQVAATRANAIGASPTKLNMSHAGERGTATIRVHRHYERGDTIVHSGARYYCMKEPWGFLPNPYKVARVYNNDHQGHAPTDTAYWYELPGDYEDTTGTLAFTNATNLVTWTGHGLSDGDTVLFDGGDLPNGLLESTVYYVRSATTNTFQVSLTPNGPVVTFSDDGTGTRGALANSVYEVPHYYSQEDLARLKFAQSNDVLTLTTFDKPVAELRRISSTKWVWDYVVFLAGATPPNAPNLLEKHRGQGDKVTATTAATPGVLTLAAPHNHATGDILYAEEVHGSIVGASANEFYAVQAVAAGTVTLKSLETGEDVQTNGTAPSNGFLRFVLAPGEESETYVVTVIDANGEESAQSDALTVDNVLAVNGAYNTIQWTAADNATRYRVYKDLNGLYGFIGETDATQFKDDNIVPDLTISPPLLDQSLRRTWTVTSFDATLDYVTITGHDLTEGMPLVFHTNDTMPTGLEVGKTYYAVNVETDWFQLATTPSGAALSFSTAGSGEFWAMRGNFPDTVAYFEQRRAFAGARTLPQHVWMTATGTENDMSYAIPIVESDRVNVKIAAREGSSVRHLVPLSQLLLLSDTIEYRLTPINDDAVTPKSISIRPQSWVGADTPQPPVVNNSVVFVAARGGHVRELGYNSDSLSYLTGDLSIRAGHLFDGFTISKIAYQKAPVPTLWFISSSGKLLSLTYVPEESVGAWAQHTTTGTFESIAVIPEGDVDAVYVTVLRTDAVGGDVRYVERMSDEFRASLATVNDAHLDVSLTYQGTAITQVTGLDHLNSKTVGVVADGVYSTATVSGGSITLSSAASTITVGLPFVSQLDSVPLYMQFGNAFGSGRQKNVTDVALRLYNSGAFQMGKVGGRYRDSREPQPGAIMTGLERVSIPGDWDDDAQVSIRKSDGLPQTIVSMTIEVAPGG